MYFIALVENNLDTGNPQVLLDWGPFERAIPDDLTGFRIYRRQPPGSFSLLSEVDRSLVDAETLAGFYEEPGEGLRAADAEMFAFNNSSGSAIPGVTGTAEYIHELLSKTPGDEGYNPMQQMFLTRFDVDIARAKGLAFIDRTVASPGMYEYMITGLIDGNETLPLGKSLVDTSQETVRPQ